MHSVSRPVWESRYRRNDATGQTEKSIEDSWQRVAAAVASAEAEHVQEWRWRFMDILSDYRFLPGGRILAGAGTGLNVTLFNCFVMGTIRDDMDSIFTALKEGALTMQAGGGVGYDFSTLRPRGSVAAHSGSVASGPVSFMHIWNSMCDTLLSTGARRGAMLASLRCDHPDIVEFIDAKRKSRALDHFNLSVQITDAFMQAVAQDSDWTLVFPVLPDATAEQGEICLRQWPGQAEPVPCRVARHCKARELWEHLMRAAYDVSEPGVLFVDRINAWNNLGYRETITTTNPCGEIPLPAYGACNLGSLNLTRFVKMPFSPQAAPDLEGIAQTAVIATRLLDNVIDISRFPLPRQAEQACGSRRVGLGITGLADMLIMLNLSYDSDAARALAGDIMRIVCHSAYRSSIQLAREKGPFPFLDRAAFLARPFIGNLPIDIREGIEAHGIRNSHLTAIAPCGTISLLAGNVSSGVEPVFDFHLQRRILQEDGSYGEFMLDDYASKLHADLGLGAMVPGGIFATSQTLPPISQLRMQAELQKHVDNAISKTVNVPGAFPFADFKQLYHIAHSLGLKGCTAFRPNPVRGGILRSAEPGGDVHCCNIEREGD